MTGLEALKEFKGNNNTMLVGRVMGKQHYLDCLQVMEKSLKALDIIKEKKVWVARLKGLFKKYNNDLDVLRIYNANMPSIDYQLTEEEFDTLKGILNDEQ